MKKMFYAVMISLCTLGWQPQECASALYRWTDSDGQMHYSATPPSAHEGNLEVKGSDGWRLYGTRTKKVSRRTYRETSVKREIIQYEESGNIMVVKVVLNKKIIGRFIVDTGASYTVILPSVLESLRLKPDKDIPPVVLNTGNGEVLADLVNLDSVTIGNIEVPNVMVAVNDSPFGGGIVGAIGQNYLNRFKMTVDVTKNHLILEPLRPLSEYAARDCARARKLVHQGRTVKNDLEREAYYYKKALNACPDSLEALEHLAGVYYYQEDYSQAIKTYLKILKMQPNHPNVRYSLGVVYANSGKFHQARVEFQKVLELYPDHTEAQEALDKLQL